MRGLLVLLAGLIALPAFAQQPSQACRVACRVSQANPSPDQRQCLAQCAAGQPITRDAPGQARPSGTQAVSPGQAAPPPPPRSTAGTPPAQPAARGAAAAPPPGRSAPASYGAVYLAVPPNMGYGMSIGQRDRLTAHRMAETACRASGANCVMAEDLREPCAAVAEGVRRAPGAFFMTSDPKTYVVRAITYRTAGNRADAEREALEVCRQRERGALTCRIVQAQCAR
jgi:hypothetical protein